jgi:hypothetical protein
VHVVAASFGALVPAAHAKHEVAPELAVNEPRGHGAHTTAPDVDEKKPAAQVLHADWPNQSWCWPGLHRAGVTVPAASLHWAPSGQSSHVSVGRVAAWLLYVPRGHA